MCEASGRKVFLASFVGVFLLAMGVITEGRMDIVAASSAPVILAAEAIVFAMIYATTFHSSNEEHPCAVSALKDAATAVRQAERSHLGA